MRYTITLDMMMDALRQGVSKVASRAKNTEASDLFRQCQAEIDATHALYRDNNVDEARSRIQTAQQLFIKAGKLRGALKSSSS